MLSKPCDGWTEFSLPVGDEDGALYSPKSFSLSYLNDVPNEWVEAAIHGLETLKPFCVEGFLEPGRLLCTVSFWNCHVASEDEICPYPEETAVYFTYGFSMLDFCRSLYEDIQENFDDWVVFRSPDRSPKEEEREKLRQGLETLKQWIEKRQDRLKKPDNCGTFALL